MNERDRMPRFSLLRNIRQDLHFSFRSLHRSPGLTSAVVLTLVIGIAAASAVGTIAYEVILQPLAIRKPSDVVVIWPRNVSNATPDFPIWGEEYRSFARIATRFEAVGAYEYHGTSPRILQVADSAIMVRVTGVSGSLFGLLGTKPVRGRLLHPDDDRAGADPVIVISVGFWRRAFAEDPNVIGRRVVTGRRTATIVGVVPSNLDFPRGAEVWIPLTVYGGQHGDSIPSFVRIVGRRKPGITNAQVGAEFLAFLRNPDAVHFPPDRVYLANFAAAVTPVDEIVNGGSRPTVLLLAGAGLLLLIATCVNVAILLLVRALSRRTEMAVRSALGASRGQVARQVFVESLMLSLVGGALALAVAWGGTQLLFAMVPIDLPHLDGTNLNAPLVVTTVLAALLAGVFIAVLPTIILSRVEPGAMLRARPGAAGGRRAERLRSSLVGLQVAMAVCSLAAAGLVVESFANLRQQDLGFQPSHLLLVRMASNAPQVLSLKDESAQYRNLLDQLATRITALPGVASVAPMFLAPFNVGGNDGTFIRVGEANDKSRLPMVNVTMGSPQFLRTLGIKLESGRTFTDADDDTHPLVVLVDETYAQQMWPAENPVGKQIEFQGGHPLTIVGVVGATHLRDFREPKGTVYIPVRQYGVPLPPYLVVRTRGDPVSLIPTIRALVKSANVGQLFVADAQPVDHLVQRELATPELSAALVAGFAVCIVLLCGIGLHGSLSAYVRNRHYDIAVRMAVGADPMQVSRAVLVRGVVISVIGAAMGGAVMLVGNGVLRAVVFGVTPSDPLMLIGSLVGVLLVAALACYLPARRSARINPVDALRSG